MKYSGTGPTDLGLDGTRSPGLDEEENAELSLYLDVDESPAHI